MFKSIRKIQTMSRYLTRFQQYLFKEFDLLNKISNDLSSEKIQSDKWSRKEIVGSFN